MGWIKERILTEYRKHYRITGGLDWSLIAEKKILAQLKDYNEKLNEQLCEVIDKLAGDKLI